MGDKAPVKYRAVLLDADDTLFDFQKAEHNAIREVLQILGVDDPVAPARYSELNRACWADFERGLITQDRLKIRRFEELLALYGRAAHDPVAVSERYEDALSRQSVLIDGALDAVKTIAAERPIAIVTNGIGRVQRGRMARSPIKQYVSALVISGEVGCAKPDPRMIEAALRALGGVRPEDALMVGDSLNSDMRCAMNASVDSCWYNPRGRQRPEEILVTYEIGDIRALPRIALG